MVIAHVLPDDVVLGLSDHFDGTIALEEVSRSLEAALRDLRGSVSEESLPEMAVRLAAVRLRHTRGSD